MPSDGLSTADVYQQLYADHAPAVLTYLTNRLRDPDAAEDVAQNTWLKAHRFLPDVLSRGDTAGKPWLMQIATRAMLDHYRAVKARVQPLDLDTTVQPGMVVPAALMDWQTPEGVTLAEAERVARRGLAGVLLLALPTDDRELVWWFEYGHRSYAALARRYDTTTSAVRQRLLRARRRLDDMVRSDRAAQQRGSGGVAVRFSHLADTRGGPEACWPWMGATNRGQRPWSPMIGVGGKAGRMVPARRVAYALQHGPLPPWLYPIASCGAAAPEACVNPAHLVGAGKRGGGPGQTGGRYAPLTPSLLTAAVFADQDLKARREALGLTLASLGEAVGVWKQTIYNVETARARWRVGPAMVQRITTTLDRLEAERRAA